MDSRTAARRWRDTWERIYRNHDSAGVAALYGSDAVLRAHTPRRAENCIRPPLAAQTSIAFEFDEPVVDGDRAAVAWRVGPRLKGGGSMLFEGVSLLRFNSEGLVVQERDFWDSTP
jgi:hypothetical protein